MAVRSESHGILRDLDRNVVITSGSPTVSMPARLRTFFTLRYQSVFLFRLAQSAGRFSGALGSLIKQFNQLVTGADLAWEADVGTGLVVFHPVGVVVGPFVKIGRECVLQQGVTLGGDGVSHVGDAPSPTLGAGVTIGAGARVIGDVEIRSRCVVGANAVVTKSAPEDGWVAVGIPAVWRARGQRPS